MTHTHLTLIQDIPASGARAAQPLRVGDLELLAVPQLAYDVPGTPAHMNGGDSDTELLLLSRDGDHFSPWGTLPAPGGEDAEHFTIDGRTFLAVASIRSGAGPYDFTVPSVLFEWTGGTFEPFQVFDGFAAKQWRHFTIDGRHFLALAQGVALPAHAADNRPSAIYEWDGARFTHFQDIPSRWGYNWHAFTAGGHTFLAHADHVDPSVLYRWTGDAFVAHQDLAPAAGRAFATFDDDAGDHTYLVVACINDDSRLLRWDSAADRFTDHQRLAGAGGRELALVQTPRARYLVRVNFIHGTPADPTAALMSQIYRWDKDHLELVEEFPTTGGTDLAVLDGADGPLLVQTNALSPELRFSADVRVYRFTD
ncbi:hypothetical protein ACIQAC_18595 [Streptomyces sp. NPDC088387]|uniref:hypothetical protein n=1 Tax=Streptomyces sp. NPDC088387 TaxID=3365859 RepID=UPI0037FF2580